MKSHEIQMSLSHRNRTLFRRPGGALCTVEELRQLHENCLVLSIEAAWKAQGVRPLECRGRCFRDVCSEHEYLRR